MANFTTHIAVGTVVSGTAATLTMAADVISPESLVAVTLAGVVGSVLPDIDLKDSRPSRALFAGLGVFFSFCVLFTVASKLSIAEMWIAWLGTLVLVRYGAPMIFHRFSAHRGIWHSILAGALFWFATAVVFHRMLGYHEGVAWLAGGFTFLGYMTHLILDEMYSVDVYDTRIKSSFGSAMKFIDGKHLGDTAVVAGLTVVMFALAPPATPFVDGITSKQLWAGLQSKLLPQDKWFGLIGDFRQTSIASPRAAAPITTGTIATSEQIPAAAASTAPSQQRD